MMKFHYREGSQRQFFSWTLFRADHKEDVRIWVNIMFILIFPKTEIARSVSGPKLQGLRAEDAMAKPYLVADNFGDLITADHKVLSDKLRISKQSSICSRGAGS